MGSPEIAQGALLVFCDESSFLSYLGTYKMVSFEDEIIGPHPSPYSVFTSDTYDEQLTIVAQHTYGGEILHISDGAPTDDEVDGEKYLYFIPWSNNPPQPNPGDGQISFSIFNGTNFAGINAFGFYFYQYDPSETYWVQMEYGYQLSSDDSQLSFVGFTQQDNPIGNYFFGVISDTSFDMVQLHTNHNGGAICIDEIYYSSYASATVPLPSAVLLLSSGLIGIAGIRRKFKK